MSSVALEEQLIADLFLDPGITDLIIGYLKLEVTYKDHRVQLPDPLGTT